MAPPICRCASPPRGVRGFTADQHFRIVALCAPSRGAGPAMRGLSLLKESGMATKEKSSPGTGCTMPSAWVCGSANTSGMLFTGAQGTPIRARRSSHAARGVIRMSAAIIGNSSALCFKRARLVENRSSLAHSAWPSSAANFAKSRASPQKTRTGPSAASNAS